MFNKYLFIIKNSFLETNKSWLSLVFSVLEPLIQIYALILVYNYLQNPTTSILNVSKEIVVYFLYILVVSSADIRIFASEIKREIRNESYLNIAKLPINSFVYYFFRSIGQNILVFCILLTISLSYMIYIDYSVAAILLFIPSVMISFILIHLIFFIVGTINFVTKHFNTWFFGIIFDFFAGKLIPFKFMPQLFTNIILTAFPFGYAFGGLARNFSEFNLTKTLISITVSIIWVAILFKLSNTLWIKGGYRFQEKG